MGDLRGPPPGEHGRGAVALLRGHPRAPRGGLPGDELRDDRVLSQARRVLRRKPGHRHLAGHQRAEQVLFSRRLTRLPASHERGSMSAVVLTVNTMLLNWCLHLHCSVECIYIQTLFVVYIIT